MLEPLSVVSVVTSSLIHAVAPSIYSMTRVCKGGAVSRRRFLWLWLLLLFCSLNPATHLKLEIVWHCPGQGHSMFATTRDFEAGGVVVPVAIVDCIIELLCDEARSSCCSGLTSLLPLDVASILYLTSLQHCRAVVRMLHVFR